MVKQGRNHGLSKVIGDIVAQGPISTAELLDRLEARGFRRPDLSELFMLCHEHHIAELDDASGCWRDPGDPASEPTTGGEGRKTSRDPQETFKTSAALRRELRSLRDRVVEPVRAPEPIAHPIAPGWKDMAAAARAALVLERSTAVSRSGWQNVELIDGEILEETPTRRIVRYEIQGSENVREGTTATLLPPQERATTHSGVNAEVLTQYGSDITLGVAAGEPFWEQARLRCDLSYLVTEQVMRFAELLSGPMPGFDSAAAMQPVSAAGMLDAVPPIEPYPVAGLNERQRLAVAHGLCPRLTWLWGPPGTGKTTTLAVLLAELLDAGKTVLLAAPTNAAIDVALSALLKRRPPVKSGEIVRIGPTDNDFLSGRARAVLLDEIAADQGAEPARRLVEARDELADLRKAHHAIPKSDIARRQEAVALTRKIADLEGFAKGLTALLGDVRDHVIGEGRLLACTSHQVVLKEAVRRKGFDVVVVYEASMMTAAMTMLVAGMGVGHTIVAGDFRQLSPIVQSQEPDAREWLGQSAFEKSGIARAVRAGRAPANLVALDTQHRMRPRIGESIGRAFYPEVGLETAASVLTRPARTIPPRHAETILIDTSDLHAPLARREGMSSRYNVMHAQLAANVVSDRLWSATEPGSIGLISPFAPQARAVASPGARA
ncbi:AAA domain-containing protein [Nocardia sp. NPDC059246]|uniref:AAA domain-containing protein n=1 Tax=unclassified Nocardia TaxID=2637762 RepID=UPI0036B81B25